MMMMTTMMMINRTSAPGSVVHEGLYKKVQAFPYSIPSVGPGADPGVQAVSPQVTVSHRPGV